MRVLFTSAALALGACAATHEGRSPTMESGEMSSGGPRIGIELLALDLETCGRCKGTAANLDEAVASVADAFREAGVEVEVRKTTVRTRADAERLRLLSSPTVRVNGHDIALELRESGCDDCGSICGCEGGIDCRVWVWRGKEYPEAPKAMIVDALLRGYAMAGSPPPAPREPYRMPANLRRFFDGVEGRTAAEAEEAPCCASGCCGTEETAGAR